MNGEPVTDSDPWVSGIGPMREAGTDAVTSMLRRRDITVSPPTRAVLGVILGAFARTGHAPRRATLGADAQQHLAALVGHDLAGLDPDGEILYAYPFAAHRTAHHVQLAGGAAVFAMCAIDALGIPAMLHRDAVITSSDPHTGGPVMVTVTGGSAVWDPPGSVVFTGARGECSAATSAQSCCGYVNFFTSAASARRWAAGRPGVRGAVLGHEQALRLGREIFGGLLG